MCELLSWETVFHVTAEWNEGVYALNEDEVDMILSSSGDEFCSSEALSSETASEVQEEISKPTAKNLAAPPCGHNTWDNIRAKKGCMTLRCRSCQEKWKVGAANLKRCRAFATGNCKNTTCTKTHIHRYKVTAESKN
eukprot:TRINITY_DN330_c14_g1_i1.p1 TRINITY_DN330_c14_g1~~TRINITY_DN330_c14_g1_i1.p1  ORF type:complete len:158 (+),score=29.42 TRINITY_DN330_c14_g1_i1:66-476(+)